MSLANIFSRAASVPQPPVVDDRALIGRRVVYVALTAVCVLAVYAMFAAVTDAKIDSAARLAHIKDVLGLALTLFGTWVGTVLAFYFSRENYAEAAKHSAALLRQLSPEQQLERIAVADVMIDLTAVDTLTLTLPDAQAAAGLKLVADIVQARFQQHTRNRLPVLDSQGRVLLCIHRSFVDKFLAARAAAGTDVNTLSLADLLADAALKASFEAFATVGPKARLLAAKQAMDGNPGCADVFVTQDGSRTGKAIGWVTDVIVLEQSSA